MTRDDLVKKLERAEQRQAATDSFSFSAIEAVFRANEALQLWDIAYATGAKDEREACAALCSEVAPSLDGQLIKEAILARGEK